MEMYTGTRTLVLLVERTVTAPAAEGMALRVPLTVRRDTAIEWMRDKEIRAGRTRMRWYLCTVIQRAESVPDPPVMPHPSRTNLSSR